MSEENQAPWAADAATYFGDNTEAIDAFNRYMTEKQQPYITQLEEGSKDARELWSDLNADPETTVRDLLASVYRDQPEVVEHYDGYFTPAEEAAIVEAAAEVPADDVPEWAKPIVEAHQAQRDKEAREAAASDYETFKSELKAEHSLSDEDMSLLDPFIMITNSDGPKAIAALRDYQAKFLAAHGVEPVAADLNPTPPPVLGTEGTATTPPAKTEYKSWDQLGDALRNYQAQQAASSTPPPIVG